MKTRLYNEYSAAVGIHADFIDKIASQAAKDIIDYAQKRNLCLRDCENYLTSTAHCYFAESILREAFKLKKEKDKNS